MTGWALIFNTWLLVVAKVALSSSCLPTLPEPLHSHHPQAWHKSVMDTVYATNAHPSLTRRLAELLLPGPLRNHRKLMMALYYNNPDLMGGCLKTERQPLLPTPAGMRRCARRCRLGSCWCSM